MSPRVLTDAAQREARVGIRVFGASVAMALVPIAVAAGAAVRHGWIPVGDNALFEIRARDVLTTHPPLLGTWTSAAAGTKTNFNHPGPLLFDVLALPTKLLGSSGMAVGVALLNCAAVLGIAILAYRRGGALVGTTAAVAIALLAWSMGSEVLFDPGQPNCLLLPFLFFLMLIWSLTCGEFAALPWAVGVGSLLVESYLVYAYLVALLGVWGAIGLALEVRRRRRQFPAPMLRTRLLRIGAVASVVFVTCWAQPVVEQFTSDGSGNLTRLIRAASNPRLRPIGLGLGTRFTARILALPPWWLRPSFGDAFYPVPTLGAAIASLSLVVALLAGCYWLSRRREDWEIGVGVVTAAVAVFAAVVAAGRVTVNPAFGVPEHVFTFLWTIGAFTFLMIVATLVRQLHGWRVPAVYLVDGLMLSTVIVVILNIPSTNQTHTAYESQIPAAQDLGRQMGPVEHARGPVLVDLEGGFDPFGPAVLAELQRRGVPFVTSDPYLLRQVGSARRFNGKNAHVRLVERTGDTALVVPSGDRRIALHVGLTMEKRVFLGGLKREIAQYVEGGRLRLNRVGQAALRALGSVLPPSWRGQASIPAGDPQPLFDSGVLVTLVEYGGIEFDPGWAQRFGFYAGLQVQSDQQTVGLYLGPVGHARALKPGA